MTLQGDFETLFLASILQLLCNEGKTGILRATDGESRVQTFFRKGAVVCAMGSQKKNRLGYLLTTNGFIEEDQLQACLVEAQQTKQALGKIVVERNLLTEKQLQGLIHKQAEELVFNMLLWQKGNFIYEDADLNLDGLMITNLNIMKIIMEATRRIDEMSILLKQIENDQVVFKVAAKSIEKESLKLNHFERSILSLVDGARTLRQIVDASRENDFLVYKALYSLISSGLIEKKKVADTQEAFSVEDDITPILVIYLEILQAIQAYLEPVLGPQTNTLIESCRPEQPPEQKMLFEQLHLSSPQATNIHFLSDVLSGMENQHETQRFLSDSFNAFIKNILTRLPSLLDKTTFQNLLSDIQRYLSQL
jgi:hypothetical protein